MIPSVGIVVPTLGLRPRWLAQALFSIRRQADVHIDTVLVTPDPQSVEPLAQRYGATVLECHIPGLAAAINEGWATLQSHDALAWLGDDDILAPGAVAASVSRLKADAAVAATYGIIRYIDGNGATLFVIRPGRLAATYFRWGKDLIPQPGSLFRSASVGQVGDVDPTLRYAMDYDYFLRLRKVGRLQFLPFEVAAYRLHPGSITGSNQNHDEAKAVRRRYHSRGGAMVAGLLEPGQGVADRVMLRALRVRPPEPHVDGMPYTQVGGVAGTSE